MRWSQIGGCGRPTVQGISSLTDAARLATNQVVLSLEKTRDARCALLMLLPFTQSDVWMLPIQAFSIRSAISHDFIHLLSGFVGAGLMFAGISGFCGLARLLVRMPWNRKAMTASTVCLYCPITKESS